MSKSIWSILILGLSGILHTGLAAQPVDTLIADYEAIALFEEAANMAVDPAGKIYVIDRGSSSLKVLSAEGSLLHEFGGPGGAEGQFDDPADIDPTNGLILVVADAGNGRLQRFSSEFLFLESLPVQGVVSNESASQPHYRQRTRDVVRDGSGRPIAVKTSPDNSTYALDTVENAVLKWDVDRNLEYSIGGFDQGDGALLEPVAIEVDSEALYVADRGQNAVFVYDAFGGFDRSMADGLCADVLALELTGDWLVVALPRKLLWYQKRGRLERVLEISLPEDIVDIVYTGEMLYILGPETLYRTHFKI